MTAPNPRDRYLQDSINTASPAKLLIMLYDRLVLDLVQGEEALRTGEREKAHNCITHAQDILLELQVTLNIDVWSGAQGLFDLYTFAITELIAANIGRDPEKVAAVRGLIEPLRDTWREAAVAAVAG